MTGPITDEDWFGIRAAARAKRWDEVVRRARKLGMVLVAEHAERASKDRTSRDVLRFALLLDRPDEPDPFADDSTSDDARPRAATKGRR